MPISCHSRDCKATLVTSCVISAIASTQTSSSWTFLTLVYRVLLLLAIFKAPVWRCVQHQLRDQAAFGVREKRIFIRHHKSVETSIVVVGTDNLVQGVPKKRNPGFNVVITSVNVHRF